MPPLSDVGRRSSSGLHRVVSQVSASGSKGLGNVASTRSGSWDPLIDAALIATTGISISIETP